MSSEPSPPSWNRREVVLLALLLAGSLALRIALFPFSGYVVDLNSFAAWHAAAAADLQGFYDSVWSDYPPLNILVFSLIGRAEAAAGLGAVAAPFDAAESLFLKLPQNLVDLGTVVLLYIWLRPRGPRVAWVGAVAYAFNPAAIFNLAVWGQWDSLYTLFMVASLITALKKRFEFSGALLALAVLTKPQGVLVMPVIAYVVLREGGLKRAVTSGLVAGAVVLAVIAPFHGAANPTAFIAERYVGGYNVYNETSLNAYNLWALAGMRVKEVQVPILGVSPQVWGWAAFLSIAGLLMWLLHKRYSQTGDRDRLLLQVAFLTVFAFFMVATRIHERYLFPALALLVLMWPKDRLLYVALTGSYLFNLAYALHQLNIGASVIGDWTIPVFVAFNAGLFAWALYSFRKGEKEPPREAPAPG